MRHRTMEPKKRVSDQRTRIEGDSPFKKSLETSYVGKGIYPPPFPNVVWNKVHLIIQIQTRVSLSAVEL